jgi:hypothetical protein
VRPRARRARAASRPGARAGALAAVALALAGCPLPQPLPDYPEGQPITPPRIVVNDGTRQIARPETVVRVPAGCAVAPVYDLAAALRDANTIETVVARWFVNYEPTSQAAARPLHQDPIPPPPSGAADPTLRETPVFTFRPYDHPPASGTGGGDQRAPGAVHVLELVVSNGFDKAADTVDEPMPALPWRTPLTSPQRFEIQVHRWTFVAVPESAAVPCPAAP